MAKVRRGDDHVFTGLGQEPRLGCQNDIAVQGMIVRRRHPLSPSFGPQLGGEQNDLGRN